MKVKISGKRLLLGATALLIVLALLWSFMQSYMFNLNCKNLLAENPDALLDIDLNQAIVSLSDGEHYILDDAQIKEFIRGISLNTAQHISEAELPTDSAECIEIDIRPATPNIHHITSIDVRVYSAKAARIDIQFRKNKSNLSVNLSLSLKLSEEAILTLGTNGNI